ncbi:MAG: GNAT family N-acetyltransferase [Acidimicrobiales bacterium]
MSETSAIIDDAVNHRFLLELEGEEAELVYRRNGGRLVLVHTGVPEALSGRGIGGHLVLEAAERARREGLLLVPVCPYARKWLESHPDAVSGTSIDWESGETPTAISGEDSQHG